MTGFARAEGEAAGISWVWELKSVNGRSLDLRLRLPPGFDALEPQLRAALGQPLPPRQRLGEPVGRPDSRRRRSASIARCWRRSCGADRRAGRRDRGGAAAARRPDRPARRHRDGRGRAGRRRRGAPRRGARRLDRWRSTGSAAARDRGRRPARRGACRRSCGELAALVEAAAALRGGAAGGDPRTARSSRSPSSPACAPTMPEERVAQELALLVTRADIREELDRLRAHIAQAGDLLRQRRGGRAAARFPVPGAEPRSQHAVLEIGRYRADPDRPGAEGRDRAVPRAGAEPRMSGADRRPRSAAAAFCWCCRRRRGPARRRSPAACSNAIRACRCRSR